MSFDRGSSGFEEFALVTACFDDFVCFAAVRMDLERSGTSRSDPERFCAIRRDSKRRGTFRTHSVRFGVISSVWHGRA
eukprot:9422969-Alexandrium_andersonii.AAC.1